MVGAERRRPADDGASRGRVLLDCRRQALPRLQQPVDVRQRRPRRSPHRPRHPGAGGAAGLCQPVHGDRRPRRARREAGRDHARRHRRLLLHQRRRRRQRERDQDRARLHRASQDPGALPFVPRQHLRRDLAHRRSPALERRTGDSGRRPRPRPVSRPRARLGERRPVAGDARGDRPARRAAHHRRVLSRDRERHQRRADPARRLPRRCPRSLHQVRDPHGLRRGHGRLRPNRAAGSRSTTGTWSRT